MALIATDALTVRRQGRMILRDITMALKEGETLAVLGPNGSGKSTFVRALVGQIKPDAGSVIRSHRVRIGYVPQFIHQDPTLPVNARTFLIQGRMRAPQDHHQIYRTVGIAPLLDRSVAALSGGELRRLGIARALLREPHVLVLDEPIAGVDVSSQESITGILASYARSGPKRATLLISHEIFSLLPYADRALLFDGEIVGDGRPEEVAASAQFERLFGRHAAETVQRILDERTAPNGTHAHG